MAQVVIDNAILNSPYHERARHRLFDDDGITNDVAGGLRPNSYFVPIAAPKKQGNQVGFETDGIRERQRENDEGNRTPASSTALRARSAVVPRTAITSVSTRATSCREHRTPVRSLPSGPLAAARQTLSTSNIFTKERTP